MTVLKDVKTIEPEEVDQGGIEHEKVMLICMRNYFNTQAYTTRCTCSARSYMHTSTNKLVETDTRGTFKVPLHMLGAPCQVLGKASSLSNSSHGEVGCECFLSFYGVHLSQVAEPRCQD